MKLIDLIVEGRYENILNKYSKEELWGGQIKEFLDDEFNKETNYKYAEWGAKILTQSETDYEGEDIIQLIKKFDKISNELDKKDINQYSSFDELKDTLIKYGPTKSEIKSDVEKIYEDDKVLVVKPLTHKASCYYGANTKWCTTEKHQPFRFEQYISDGALYYIIFRKLNIKFAVYYKKSINKYIIFDQNDKVIPKEVDLALKDTKWFKAILKDKAKQPKEDVMGNKIKIANKIIDAFSGLINNTSPRVIYKGGHKINIFSEKLNDITLEIGKRIAHIKLDGIRLIFWVEGTNIYEESKPLTSIPYLTDYKRYVIIRDILEHSSFIYNRIIIDRIVNYYLNKFIDDILVNNEPDVVKWQPENSVSKYRFLSKDPKNTYVKFLNYVKRQTENNLPATKEEFIKDVLGRKDVNIGGYLSIMFGSLRDAGLVTIYRSKEPPYFRYKLGPGYKYWLEGKLERR